MKIIVISQSLFVLGALLFSSAILMIIVGLDNSQTTHSNIQLNFFVVGMLQFIVGGWLMFFGKALQSFTGVKENN